MNVFVIGDVVGPAGCNFIREHLTHFKKMKKIDVCLANGENSAAGNGITPSSANHLFDSGVDLITTGNHCFRRQEMYEFFDSSAPVIRPANYHKATPGKGYFILEKGSIQLAVINLMGTVYMENLDNPFECIDKVLDDLSSIKVIMVDFHAEATAEKRAMGFYLDGRISAIFGTHTHVQTSDGEILPQSTGYITDIGMTGPIHSVLGVCPSLAIEKLKTHMPVRFDNADGECKMEGCIFEIDNKTGKTISIEPISIR